jgi:hypothetical protein
VRGSLPGPPESPLHGWERSAIVRLRVAKNKRVFVGVRLDFLNEVIGGF